MKTRLELEVVPQPDFFIHHQQHLITAGSCFATCTAQWLKMAKFQVLENPFGIIFNPLTLCELLEIAATQAYEKLWLPALWIERDGYWFHYYFHSSITAESRTQLAQRIEERLQHLHHVFNQSPVLLLTLGTAWVYELREMQKTVANCHKMPSQWFEKKLLSVSDIVKSVEKLLALKPIQKIILTVSPVIHLKDTLPLNQVSKSVLRLATHELATRYPQRISYFPAYELLRDDLRDYRFFDEDMLHPSAQAEKYIYNKFTAAYFSATTQALADRCLRMQQQLSHRPLHEKSAGYEAMLQKCLHEVRALHAILPRWQQEIQALEEKIAMLAQK